MNKKYLYDTIIIHFLSQQIQFFVFVFTNKCKHICRVISLQLKRIQFSMRFIYSIKPLITQRPKWVVVAALWLCCASTVLAQGWERIYGDENVEEDAASVIQTEDHGYITLGQQSSLGGFDIFAIRTDVDGTVIWQRTYGQPLVADFGSQIIRVNGGYVIVGTTEGSGMGGERDIFLFKINEKGDVLWTSFFGGGLNDEGNSVFEAANGDLIIAGTKEISDGDDEMYLLRTDADGNLIWDQTSGQGSSNEVANAVIEVANGDIIMAGYVDNSGDKNVYIQQVSPTGSLGWSRILGGTGEDEAFSLVEAVDGSVAIAGQISNAGEVYFIRLDPSNMGSSIVVDIFNKPGFQKGNSIISTQDGNLVITGISEPNAIDGRVFLLKIDLIGQMIWEQEYGTDRYFNQGNSVIENIGGGFVITGSSAPFQTLVSNVILIKTDSEGNILTNQIQGNIYEDLDNNCELSATEEGIAGWIVTAKGPDKTFYGISDTEGNYNILVDVDSYEVSLVRPNRYWEACTNMYSINFTETYDTITRNFPTSPAILCTDLEIDISTPFLEVCEENVYTVTYCNHGTIEADDAFVEVLVDEDLSVLDYSIPLTAQINNLYRFDVGDVDPGECRQFTIDVAVDCAAVLGQAHCIKAEIFPDSICLPTPGWNGASLKVEGICEGDSVKFTISNDGTGAVTPSQNRNFIVIEDIVLREAPQQIELAPGETQQMNFEANGATFRLTAEQAVGHPGNSIPTLAIEGCDPSGSGYSIGFLTQFPEDDNDHTRSIDCQENIDIQAFGPYFKRGYPKGYGDSLLIEPQTDLKYSINFQNVGTDTAIRVVIRDTLSSFLDPATVRPGASSHDYILDVYDNGILKFTFENINLVGSSIDELRSRGFVKYRVSQKLDNPIGTQIKNNAAIYLHYNAPALTGNTCHRIGENFILVNTEHIFAPEISNIKVYPNPFQELATFEIESTKVFRQLYLKIYDLNGRLIREEAFDSMTFTFERKNLASGLYIYELNSDNQQLSSGKITVQ